MDVLKCAERAKGFYEDTRPGNLEHGFKKMVLTDGDRVLFIKTVDEMELKKGEMVFIVETRNGVTMIEEL